jgi:hypothetical protein
MARVRDRPPARPSLAGGLHHPLHSQLIEQLADRLEVLPARAARFELSQRVDYSFRLEGIARTAALDLNARLVTELRERGVRLWSERA